MDQRNEVIAQLRGAIMTVDPAQIEALAENILAANEVFCHGLGRSGLSTRAFAMRLMHLGRKVSIVGDTLAHRIHEGDLLLLTSASGASLALLYAAKLAKSQRAKVALVTGAERSDLADLADLTLLLRAPSKDSAYATEASVLPMGSLFEEASYVLYDVVVLKLMEKLGMTNDDMAARHANLE